MVQSGVQASFASLDPLPVRARDKVRTIEEMAAIAKHSRQRGQTVVLAHGVFDLLHMGHVRHLEAAICCS